MPARPACATPTTPAPVSASSTGTQSATITASAVPGVRVTSDVGGRDGVTPRLVGDGDVGAVHLVGEEQPLRGDADAGRQAPAGAQHPLRVVAHVQAQVVGAVRVAPASRRPRAR